MTTNLLLYGGGIDSSVLLAYAATRRTEQENQSLYAMFIRYGQKAEAHEEQACKYFCEKYNVPLTILDAPFAQITSSAIMSTSHSLANDPSINIVDGRNFAFLGLAGMFAAKIKADHVMMGYHVEPIARPFPDASIEFVHAMNRMIPFAFKHTFTVTAPFAEWTRKDIFKWGLEFDNELVNHAHTCYENVLGGCGQCSHCVLKKELLAEIAKETGYQKKRIPGE